MIKTLLPHWVSKYVKQAFVGDCWDLVASIQRDEFDITIRRKDISGWARVMKPREGDVIAIGFPKPTHIGVVCDGSFFVHLLKKAGVACSRYDSIAYKKRVYGFFRHESRLP